MYATQKNLIEKNLLGQTFQIGNIKCSLMWDNGLNLIVLGEQEPKTQPKFERTKPNSENTDKLSHSYKYFTFNEKGFPMVRYSKEQRYPSNAFNKFKKIHETPSTENMIRVQSYHVINKNDESKSKSSWIWFNRVNKEYYMETRFGDKSSMWLKWFEIDTKREISPTIITETPDNTVQTDTKQTTMPETQEPAVNTEEDSEPN